MILTSYLRRLKVDFFRRFEMAFETSRSFRDNKVPVNLWIHIQILLIALVDDQVCLKQIGLTILLTGCVKVLMGQPKDYLTAVNLQQHATRNQLTALLRIAIAAFNFVTCYVTICVRKYMTEQNLYGKVFAQTQEVVIGIISLLRNRIVVVIPVNPHLRARRLHKTYT